MRHASRWSEEFLLGYVVALNRVFQFRRELSRARTIQEYDEALDALKKAEQQGRMLRSLLATRMG